MKVGIVGVGLIGGSIAYALSQHGVALYLDDANPETARELQHRQLGQVAPYPQWASLVDQVVLALPMSEVPPIIDDLVPRMAEHSQLVDFSSLKLPLSKSLVQAGRRVTVVALHLMAGREVNGLDAARADLFSGWPLAVVDVGLGYPPAGVVDWWQSILHTDEPSYWSAAQHDAAIAWVSHLPYVVSRALRQAIEDHQGEAWRLRGPGYRDTTRVGMSPWEPLAGQLQENHQELEEGLDRVIGYLKQYRESLAKRGDNG